MIISYNWLKELCPHDLAADALAERLSHAGLCVETCEPREDDWVLEVDVTANRPDCLSHIGIAREAAALTGRRVCRPEVKVAEDASVRFNGLSSVKVECPDLCPHYTARVILGVKVGPSPEWMQRRLVTCGLRPVNNIVDVTNYVLLESGQPLHTFDMALLDERRIVVRRAGPSETMVAIDGTQCRLSPEMCVIADARKPVAIAGVMGGMESEIRDSTSDVLLESARFCPPNIRRTSRALGLSSDSSYRFERGVDPENVERASRRAAQLILELAGGRLASGLADVRDDRPKAAEVTMRFERLAMVLGLKVDAADVRRIFEGLEIEITKQTRSAVTVVVPSWRASDLTREIDLIEEIVRIHGYDRISETTRIPVTVAKMSARERCMRTARHLLAGEGFDEVVTFSLIAPGKAQIAQPWHDGGPIALRNPFSADRTHLRLTNMANLLGVKGFNASHGAEGMDLFELAKVYVPRNTAADEQPEEKLCLSLLTDREDGFLVLKGALANVLEALHVEGSLSEEPAQVGPFAEGESLRLLLDDRLLGCVGIVSESMAAELDVDARPALLEVDFDLLIEKARIDATLRPIPKFPSVERDIAVVVDEAVRWSDLRCCVLASSVEHLEAIEFFDVYRGQQVPAGKKSIAFSLTFRASDRTLTGEEVDAARDRVVAALAKGFGATLR